MEPLWLILQLIFWLGIVWQGSLYLLEKAYLHMMKVAYRNLNAKSV